MRADFDAFYEELIGERWAALRAALQEPRRPIEWNCGGILAKPYVLDEASVIAATALGVVSGERVLDLCAAPGGKTLILAAAMGTTGELIANDRSLERRKRLSMMLREHLPADLLARVRVTGRDGSKWGLHEPSLYDRVLVDAPCSGERHLLANGHELEKWSRGRSRSLARRQLALVCAGFDALRAGGTLLFCTCSVSPHENDAVIHKFQKKRRLLFESSPIRPPPPAFGEPTEFGLRIWPDTAEGRGPIYFARLRKRAGVAR